MATYDTFIYDIETYGNIFTFTIIREDEKFLRVFEISDRKDEVEGLLACFRYLRDNNQKMVGFNNIGFDYPIIHEIMQRAIAAKKKGIPLSITAKQIFDLAQKQIESFRGEGFGNTIKVDDELIKQVDLYKIHHFDNKARSTSLKMLEFNMRADNIEDLPFEIGASLTSEEMDTLIEYNIHDVMMTLKFYKESIGAIEFRQELSERLGKDFTNANDTKVGKDYFIMELEKAMPGSCYKQQGNYRKVQQSKRASINLGDCLFDYYDFHRPEFKAVQEWLKNQTITETKGVFTNVEEHLLGDISKYTTFKTKRQRFFSEPTEEQITDFKQQHPMGWIEEFELKSPKGAKSYWKYWRVTGKEKVDGTMDDGTLNVMVDGFQFDFGTGGLHGSLNNTIVRSDDEYIIIDYDVASYYPNLAIANRVYPEHLSEKFCQIYEDVYNRRKSYAKGTPENALFKLALNGVYGDSNNQYSPFYDPKYTMTITLNGQLSLCMLVDRLIEIDGLSMVQANTDGITVKCRKDDSDRADSIVKQWEELTGLQMERADYSTMYLRDVNNYIAVYKNGKVKRKGAYEYEGLGWHQNQSALVIQKAAEQALLYGKDVSTFICSHEDKWDFMLRAKVPRSSRLMLKKQDGSEVQLQNICRYYPSKSKDAGHLIKIMPPLKGKEELGERKMGIGVDYTVVPCNNIKDFKWNLDYSYYINEANKLVIGG